jgi:hypothetical protein
MNELSSDIIFATAYLPPVEYISYLNKNKRVFIDVFENYIKQTYRNRCYIMAANGKLCLSIPVIKTFGNHTKVKDIEIDYSQPWQRLHWRSIESAYNTSPFFLYYRDSIEPFYEKKFHFLIDLNTEILAVLLKLCGISSEIQFTESYIENVDNTADLRNNISPKFKIQTIQHFPKYNQVFSDKHGFSANLSIIDLLFNEGKYCKEYLMKTQVPNSKTQIPKEEESGLEI